MIEKIIEIFLSADFLDGLSVTFYTIELGFCEKKIYTRFGLITDKESLLLFLLRKRIFITTTIVENVR